CAALGDGRPCPGTAGPTVLALFLLDVVGFDEAAQMFAERRIAKPGNLLEGLCLDCCRGRQGRADAQPSNLVDQWIEAVSDRLIGHVATPRSCARSRLS